MSHPTPPWGSISLTQYEKGSSVPLLAALTDFRDRQAALQLGWRPLSDRELVERLLPLSNIATERQMAEIWEFVGFGVFFEEGWSPQLRSLMLGYEKHPVELIEQVRQWWTEIKAERTWFQERLITLIRGSREGKACLVNEAVELQADVVPVSQRRWQNGEFVVETRLYPLSIKAAAAYVLLLLLDRKRLKKLGGNLARCRLDACGAFFLSVAPAKGGPRPKYCSQTHQGLAAKLTAAERTQRWRKRQAAKHK